MSTAEIETKVVETTFKQIRVHDGFDRCRLCWQDETGHVIIASSYGHWQYYWTSIGNRTLAQFLAKLDMHYMGGKMLGIGIDVNCDRSTIQCIREHIIEYRRDCTYTKEFAREEWQTVDSWESGMLMDFREWCETTKIDDAYELRRKIINPSWEQFWNKLWVPLVVPVLKTQE